MQKLFIIAAFLVPLTLGSGYEEHGYGHSEGHGYGGGHGGYEKSYEPHYPPQPYKFGYDIKDGYGGTLNQKEEGDSHGNKKGSYGYTDSYGIYRQVDYVADKHGFRASVKTNEPGTANQNPADVYIHSSAGPSHYESAPYKSASYSAPSYAPAKEAYGPVIKLVAPIYKSAPVGYSAPKPLYKMPSYGNVAQAYLVPSYSEHY